jgi:hypothetical protein
VSFSGPCLQQEKLNAMRTVIGELRVQFFNAAVPE